MNPAPGHQCLIFVHWRSEIASGQLPTSNPKTKSRLRRAMVDSVGRCTACCSCGRYPSGIQVCRWWTDYGYPTDHWALCGRLDPKSYPRTGVRPSEVTKVHALRWVSPTDQHRIDLPAHRGSRKWWDECEEEVGLVCRH